MKNDRDFVPLIINTLEEEGYDVKSHEKIYHYEADIVAEKWTETFNRN